MLTFLQDLRFSVRTLHKSSGFAFTAILTLALGIGAVTSVFSVVNSVLLKPFAFPEPDRLVVIREQLLERSSKLLPDNYKHYLNWQTNSRTFQGMSAFRNISLSVTAATDHPEIVSGLTVTPSFFSVLGITPILGRGFLPEEAIAGRDNVVILSWEAWQKYFQGAPNVIGRSLRIGGDSEIVVGVLPRGFLFPRMNEIPGTSLDGDIESYEVFVPLVVDARHLQNDGSYNYLAIGRLRAGVSLAQAQNELSGIQRAFHLSAHTEQHPSVAIESLKQEVAGGVSKALWLLLAAVGAVLLITCVNLANLQLARAVARERELAVRAALGADRGRLLWSTLMDSLLLAIAGGGLGICLSYAGVRSFLSLAPASLPRLNEVSISWPVLLAATVLTLLTAFLFGAMPAMRSMRVDPHAAMQSNSNRVASAREGERSRQVLVTGEVACTVVLLVVTGLLVRSFSHLLTQQRDFDSSNVTLAEVNLYTPEYGSDVKHSDVLRARFIDRALERLQALPGVQSVATTSEMPMGGDTWIDYVLRPDHPVSRAEAPLANIRWVSPGYIDTLKIPLLAGRNLEPSDKDHPDKVLISEQTAREVWPGENPLGRTVVLGGDEKFTVVGIVGDARINDLKKTSGMIYLPYWEGPQWRQFLFIRSSRSISSDVGDAIRKTIWSIDPQVAIPMLKSLDDQVAGSVATERFQTILLSSFGGAALLLAVLGIYGVLTYSISLREREFGIRMALGSDKLTLVRHVISLASPPIFVGILLGLVGAFGAARWIESLLYETKAADPLAIGVSLALLLGTALLAAVLPAWRAANVEPVEVLRSE